MKEVAVLRELARPSAGLDDDRRPCSLAASMMACICSISLTLNAPTPYPPLAASSRSCRMETRAWWVLLLVGLVLNFGRPLALDPCFCTAGRAAFQPVGRQDCNRPYGSRAPQGKNVLQITASVG